ncbi:MAG TPA: Ig-like domain-containing protein [Terriglobia bacterium]|nr:Ig-like domain-containing protein [Terriglobia bacterium]
MFGDKGAEKYIALLDHVGMTVEDIETRFSDWGNPDAYLGQAAPDEIVEGGHGNGGKCYMTQMFESHSYLCTVKGTRGSKYGFIADDPNPGYFPDKQRGRGFPVSKPVDELRRALSEIGVDFARLPDEVQTAAARRDGFTLVAGVGPRNFGHRDAAEKLVESVLAHPQSLITLQRTRVFVVINGRPVATLCPVRLPDIPPHPEAAEPRIVVIPRILMDPQTEAEVITTMEPSAPQGKLIIKTSEKSMRWGLRTRHCITFFAYKHPIAFLPMEDIARTTWVDRMYGECHLDGLRKYEKNERQDLADSPLTRAMRAWVKDQVLAYEAEFRRKDRLKASQAQQEALRKQNEFLNKWIQKSLEEEMSAKGTGRGKGGPKPTPARPLPQEVPVSVEVNSPFARAGVGVCLNLRVTFRDAEGKRVAPVPFMWYSSDWAVATVDSDISAVVTHTPGVTSVWIETLDKKLRSNPVEIEVVNIKAISIRPPELTLQAGQIQQLEAIVNDRDNREFSDVYLTWLQDDSAVVSVTATGKVIARRQGTTTIQVGDDNYTDDSCKCIVTVTPSTGPRDQGGKNFPRIRLSEIEPDPLNPDGEPCHLSPQDGPVHQPTPQHVVNNIWFINMTCPLAKYYFEKGGADTVEWRAYHLERFVEALVKIKLSNLYQENEGISFDEMERQWREQASEVQARAIDELAQFLEGEAISELW